MPSLSIKNIESNGVVGAGGAGFPTHVKLNAKADTIILNAAECEPLLHKDKELLRAFGQSIIDGFEAARQFVKADRAIIGIKGKYADVIDQLQPLLPPAMSITPLTNTYPTGDEFILVYDTTGRIISPGQIPLSVGCVVINVETALNIALNQPVTKKYLTVAGAVKNPVTIGVPVGTTYAKCIELAGGTTTPDPFLLVGGVMMGKFCTDFNEVVTKTTGGLIVLDQSHQLYRRYDASWQQISRIGASACDQCSFCTEFCPRYLLGHPIEPHKAMRSLVFSQTGVASIQGTDFCCECNLCTMISCPEDLDPKNVCSQNKHERAGQQIRWDNPPVVEKRAELHLNNRRVPISRLMRKLSLTQFNNTGPLLDSTVTPTQVRLSLQQHIGAPAQLVVSVGQKVNVGDVVAKAPDGKLGANIHASITGKVTAVTPEIIIEA